MTNKSNPASGGTAVTPHDTNANVFRSLYVGTGGNLTVISENGNTVLFKNVPSGFIVPISTVKVLNTGTTCSDITGLL